MEHRWAVVVPLSLLLAILLLPWIRLRERWIEAPRKAFVGVPHPIEDEFLATDDPLAELSREDGNKALLELTDPTRPTSSYGPVSISYTVRATVRKDGFPISAETLARSLQDALARLGSSLKPKVTVVEKNHLLVESDRIDPRVYSILSTLLPDARTEEGVVIRIAMPDASQVAGRISSLKSMITALENRSPYAHRFGSAGNWISKPGELLLILRWASYEALAAWTLPVFWAPLRRTIPSYREASLRELKDALIRGDLEKVLWPGPIPGLACAPLDRKAICVAGLNAARLKDLAVRRVLSGNVAAPVQSHVVLLCRRECTSEWEHALRLAASWRQAGATVAIQAVPQREFQNRLRERDFDAFVKTFGDLLFEDPDLYFHSSQASNGFNVFGYRNPDCDTLLGEMDRAFDAASRRRLSAAIRRKVLDDGIIRILEEGIWYECRRP